LRGPLRFGENQDLHSVVKIHRYIYIYGLILLKIQMSLIRGALHLAVKMTMNWRSTIESKRGIYIYSNSIRNVNEIQWGGPRLCLGGRSPSLRTEYSDIYIYIYICPHCIPDADEFIGGPQALPGGAKPFSTDRVF